MPVCYRVRLGRRFMPRDNLRETIAELQAYLEGELGCPDGVDPAANVLAQPQNGLDLL
jgi:hypothetical protein